MTLQISEADKLFRRPRPQVHSAAIVSSFGDTAKSNEAAITVSEPEVASGVVHESTELGWLGSMWRVALYVTGCLYG